MSRTTIVSAGLAAFLIGLVLARRITLISFPQFLIAIVLLSPLLFYRNILSVLSIIAIGMSIGCIRGTQFAEKLVPYRDLQKTPVTILATASSDAVYGEKSQIEFDVGNIILLEPYYSELVGTIGVRGFGEPMVYKGDSVVVSAKLYPSRGSRQARMSFAKIERVNSDSSWINNFRRKFASGIQSALPEPLGSFGLGILIGQRTTLPDELNQAMSVTGLTHIVAVSGYNVTIIVQMVHRLVRRRSKFQSTLITLGLIGLFLAITGSSASIVRAAIVSGLSIWAWYYGRTFKPLLLILLAAVITAGYYPSYLWSDIGWHLSFLAFFGVLVLAPAFQARYLSKRRPKILLQLLLETSSAQLMTLPLIMYIFGRLSVVALLANILIVPLVPLAMGLGFVAGMAGAVAPQMMGWLAWPANICMTYMLDMVQLMSSLPKASIWLSLSLSQMLVVYGIVVLLVFTWKHKKAKITDRTQRLEHKYERSQ